jgi:hypothetical protein
VGTPERRRSSVYVRVRYEGSLMDIDVQARSEMQDAWKKVKDAVGELGLDFGKKCCKWHEWYLQKSKDKGDRIRFMWKSLGIPHTAAYYWMDEYKASIGEQKSPEVERYTAEELARNEIRAANENRLEKLFKDCGFDFFVRQNCATHEYHFNVVFSALTEKQVESLAKRIK